MSVKYYGALSNKFRVSCKQNYTEKFYYMYQKTCAFFGKLGGGDARLMLDS